MKKQVYPAILSALVLAAGFCAPSAAQAKPLYRLVQSVPLGGGIKWDYLHFDAPSGRVYISHGTELTVVSAKTGAIIGHVTGLNGSHGVAIDTAAGLGFADSGKSQSISIFDLKTLVVSKTIPALEDADGMVFDAPSNQVLTVGGDANAVLAVDAGSDAVRAAVALGGSPESMVSDQAGTAYININDKNELVRVDTKTDTITARWQLPGCEGPTGRAIDTANHVLFSSCANAVMSVVNGETGAILATLPIGKGTDSADFDPARKLAFSANRDGTLSVIQEVSPETFNALPPVQTALGARTLAVDTSNGRIFLVTAKVVSAGPPKHPGGAPSYVFAPGSVKLLVYAPAS